MRIAFSGSHRVGKSTLVERVAEVLADHAVVDEPYNLLEEDGYEFADPPSIEDFEAQLERSLEAVDAAGPDVLFDRSPADILAYLVAHDDAAAFDSDPWLDRIREAMNAFDLVVYVPIEDDDRIPVAAHEDRELRLNVHDQLEELVGDRTLDFDTEVLTVSGDIEKRVAAVLARVSKRTARRRSGRRS